jgi:cysteinyl-tRNA synthetase
MFAREPKEFLAELRAMRARRKGIDPDRVAALLEKRQDARKSKDFAAADAVRDELSALGVAVKDTPQGPDWDVA